MQNKRKKTLKTCITAIETASNLIQCIRLMHTAQATKPTDAWAGVARIHLHLHPRPSKASGEVEANDSPGPYSMHHVHERSQRHSRTGQTSGWITKMRTRTGWVHLQGTGSSVDRSKTRLSPPLTPLPPDSTGSRRSPSAHHGRSSSSYSPVHVVIQDVWTQSRRDQGI